MLHQDFSFLSRHFAYEIVDLKSHHRFSQLLTSKNKISYPEFTDLQYAEVFYEKECDNIISWSLSSSKDNNYDAFDFYLKQLPSFTLSNVAYFFSLIAPDIQLANNVFAFKKNYPSEFCRDFLNITHGYVVYTYQLMQLIDFCMPLGKSGHNLMNEYRRLFNLRSPKMFSEIEQMYLPDGNNLGELLQLYTPIKYTGQTCPYGFVINPTYVVAHSFIACVRKYIHV